MDASFRWHDGRAMASGGRPRDDRQRVDALGQKSGQRLIDQPCRWTRFLPAKRTRRSRP